MADLPAENPAPGTDHDYTTALPYDDEWEDGGEVTVDDTDLEED